MIGKAITKVITADQAITAIISDRIYPMSSKAQALPSIYYNVSVQPHQNKNGQQGQAWTLEILTMCETYAAAWDLAKLIKRVMLHQRRRDVDEVKFIDIECTNIKDDYEFNIQSFGQILTFEIRTNNLI